MFSPQHEIELDSMIQQTWKRMRSPEEINSFLARRERALQECDVELDY